MFDLKIYNNIPEEMKAVNRWVCYWITEKYGKMPISAKTGKAASTTDAATWADFNTATKYCESNPKNVSGLGFVFSDEDDVVGIDFDDCLNADGNLINDTIKEIVSRNNSYIERSVSGTGLHIYVRGKLPRETGIKISKEGSPLGFGIELYSQKRFFIVTGNTYPDSDTKLPLTEGQSLIDYVINLLPVNNTAANEPVNTTNVSNEIRDIDIEAVLKSNRRLKQLWDGERPKGNESSDDMALLYQLALLTDNPEQIKNLFFSSPHYETKDDGHKRKCQRDDYMARSISAAVNYVSNNSMATEDECEYLFLLNYPDNDSGNGEKFAAMYGNELVYIEDGNYWLHYDEIYWAPFSQVDLEDYAKKLQQAFERAAQITNDRNRLNAARGLGNMGKLRSMIEAAKSELRISPDSLNVHNDLLAVANGVINLRTGKMVQPRPDYYITIKCPISYYPEAAEPERFIKFMHEITCGDCDLYQYLLRCLGYCLTGETREQVYFIFHGSGSNGKSLLVNLLKKVLGGEITGSVAQDAFVLKKSGNSLNPSLADCMKTRICFITEGNKHQEMDTALLKAITGEDDIQLRFMHKNHQCYNPRFKIIIATNYMPCMDYSDYGIQRRTKIIRFENTFTGDKMDKNLLSKLQNEAEGILKVLVHYAVMYYRDGLSDFEPQDVSNSYNDCLADSDNIFAFVRAHVEESDSPDDYIGSTELYNHYRTYCQENQLPQESQRAFTMRLHSLGYETAIKTKARVVCFTGITYKTNDTDDNDTDNSVSAAPDKKLDSLFDKFFGCSSEPVQGLGSVPAETDNTQSSTNAYPF